jgi:hypothetical protein
VVSTDLGFAQLGMTPAAIRQAKSRAGSSAKWASFLPDQGNARGVTKKTGWNDGRFVFRFSCHTARISFLANRVAGGLAKAGQEAAISYAF